MKTQSTFVCTIELDTGEEVEIRRLEGGPLVGFDACYLSQLDEYENPNNPYESGVVLIPDNEAPLSEGTRVFLAKDRNWADWLRRLFGFRQRDQIKLRK